MLVGDGWLMATWWLTNGKWVVSQVFTNTVAATRLPSDLALQLFQRKGEGRLDDNPLMCKVWKDHPWKRDKINRHNQGKYHLFMVDIRVQLQLYKWQIYANLNQLVTVGPLNHQRSDCHRGRSRPGVPRCCGPSLALMPRKVTSSGSAMVTSPANLSCIVGMARWPIKSACGWWWTKVFMDVHG